MKENPYNELLGIMGGVAGESQSPCIQIGIVQTPPPALTVLYNGITLNKNDLFVNSHLLVNYYREHKGHIVSATQFRAGGSGDPEFESHNHDIHNDYTRTDWTTDTPLKPGTKVAMMPMAGSQKYIVLCVVVMPDWSDVNNG